MNIRTKVFLVLFFTLFVVDLKEVAAEVVEDEPVETLFPQQGEVNVRSARFRRGPGVSHAIVGHLEEGQLLTLMAERQGWYLIADPVNEEEPIGYMKATLVQLLPQEEEVESSHQEWTEFAEESNDAEIVEMDADTEQLAGKDISDPVDTEMTTKISPEGSAVAKSTPGVTLEPTKEEPLSTEGPWYENWHRQLFLQISPGFDIVDDIGATAMDDRAFRIRGKFGMEVLPTFFIEGLYSYTGYTPGQRAQEAGGGFRYMQKVFWRLKPFVSADAFYARFRSRDTVGYGGEVGLTIDLGGWPYNFQMGPSFGYNHILLSGTGDVDSWVVAFSIILVNVE